MKKGIKAFAILAVLFIMIGMMSGCSKENTTVARASKNRLEEIQKRGYIEVVTEPYFAPFEFIDPSKEGEEKYVGSDMKLAQYIADKLGVELRIIPLEFSAALGSITENKYDLAISALSYTPARAEAMNISKGYYFAKENAGHGLLIRKEDADIIKDTSFLEDKVMVVQSGSLQEVFVNEQVPKYKELKRVSSTNDGFLMVQEGKADVAAASIPMAKLYIEANPGAGLMIVEDFEFVVDESVSGNRIGIPKGEEELTEKVNEIIDEVVGSGIFEEWHTEYTEYAKNLGL